MTIPDPLVSLKEALLTLRGLHLQARAVLLAAQRISSTINPADVHFDDFAAVANALAELNLAMNARQVELLDRIHAAEQSEANLH